MVRELLKKIFRPSSKKPAKSMDDVRSEAKSIDDVRGEAHDKAEELTPGHSDRAASIGVFHN